MLKIILRYGLFIALLLLASRFLDYGLFAKLVSFEVYVGVLALLFTGLGIWMGLRLTAPKTVIQKVRIPSTEQFELDPSALDKTGISSRELEVLRHIAEGKSNQEIAESLYISLSTVKSHVSHIYEKLDVKRRTQAIQAGQEKGLLP